MQSVVLSCADPVRVSRRPDRLTAVRGLADAVVVDVISTRVVESIFLTTRGQSIGPQQGIQVATTEFPAATFEDWAEFPKKLTKETGALRRRLMHPSVTADIPPGRVRELHHPERNATRRHECHLTI
jgi:hypothetical protein